MNIVIMAWIGVLSLGLMTVYFAKRLLGDMVPWKHCRAHDYVYIYAKRCPHCLYEEAK